MAVLSAVAAGRLFDDVWICMQCGAKNRGNGIKKPDKCRKCKKDDFRLKKKGKKKAA